MSGSAHANTLLVVRNGIFSNAAAMENLETYLHGEFPGCIDAVDSNYRWQKPILHSGVDLAELVLERMKQNPAIDKVVLVGHSQGGLACRVAAAALCANRALLAAVSLRTPADREYYEHAERTLSEMANRYGDQLAQARRVVHSVVMLATPNAGAFTNGQFALQGTIALRTLKTMAALGDWKNFDELTTEKLFRVLQNLRIQRVRYVSISGSYFNRYKALGWSNLSSLPVISRLAPSLELPNDTVVEDSAVDLRQAPLPTEIDDLDAQYTHVRAYTECILTDHSSIHSDQTVFEALDRVPRWK